MNTSRLISFAAAVMLCAGPQNLSAQHTMVLLSSDRDIQKARPSSDEIRISHLPIESYPKLAKFHNLQRIDFATYDGTGGTDEKLQALTKVGFTNVSDICLLNSPLVTDKGIESLAQLPALRSLQLEGTSITDTGCKTLASKRSATGVNVAHCTNVTLKGILELSRSETLDGLSFSYRGLSQNDVIRVIGELRHAKWCQIVDPDGELDADVLKRVEAERGVTVVLHPQGALRTLLGEKPRPWTPKDRQNRP